MALKMLMRKRKLDELKKQLENIRSEQADFLMRESEIDTRESEAIKALEEMTDESTQEERDAVEQEAEAIETARAELAEVKKQKETEIAELEQQIRELEAELVDVEPPVVSEPEQEAPAVKRSERREDHIRMNKYETRAQMLERLERDEVRDFYTKLVEAAKEGRALTGGDETIPEIVVDMIMTRMGDYAKVKPLVNVVRLKGTARVLLDGAIPEGVWVECCEPVSSLTLAISKIDLDCYKAGGYVEVCNAIIHDSLINMANYVEDKIAQAIAKAVDKAILVGAGSASKQPEGIIPALELVAGQQFTAADLEGIMAAIAVIDTGEEDVGALTAVMRRSTYYTYIQPDMLLATAAGTLAMQSANEAVLPDGTKVVFSQYVPAGQIVIGDFRAGYILAERQELTLSISRDVKFIEDNTVFKGIARYDGKPTNTKYFVLISLDPRLDAATGLTITAAAGTTAGTTKLTASPVKAAGSSHLVLKNGPVPAVGEILTADEDGWDAYTAGNELAVIAGEKVVVAEVVTSTGAVVKAGSLVILAAKIGTGE